MNVIRRFTIGVTIPKFKETRRGKDIKPTLLKKETQRNSSMKNITLGTYTTKSFSFSLRYSIFVILMFRIYRF